MAVTLDDIEFNKSVTVTDTVGNGGRRGDIVVVSGARHNLFPRVTRNERISGVTKRRKEFWSNKNPDNDIAYDAFIFFETQTNSGDRYYIGKGDHMDTQQDIDVTPPIWMGCGKLATALSGGEMSIDLDMENDDYAFPNGSFLHIADKVISGVVFDSNVRVGDSVQETGGTWYKIAATTDIIYPNGIRIDADSVLSLQPSTNEQWAQIAEKYTIDETIATGDGSSVTLVLSALTNITNGVSPYGGYRPVIKAIVSGIEEIVDVDEDGYCSGFCTAGRLNMETGAWITDITFTAAPDNGEVVTCSYADIPFDYTGNQVTVELSEPIANAYTVDNTFAACCIQESEVKPTYMNLNVTSGSGSYDDTGFPIIPYNTGTVDDTITIMFTSATAFDCNGLYEGSMGSGVITSDFEPVNPRTGERFFTLLSGGFGGSWSVGDTITFETRSASVPLWWKEVVPPGTSEEPDNLSILGWYCE